MTKTLAGPGGPFFVPSRRRLACTALALALSFAAPLAPQPAGLLFADTQHGYLLAGTIGEVVSLWRPETHLYVIGDVGLGEDALRALAASLADTHWTVLLVRDATGQSYPDFDGMPRYGDEAIEYGTGQGITLRYGFAEQLHPRTKERDGAIFSVVLDQRALFYTGSEAQDNRGLGEDQFKDDLDRWAIQAMREGRDLASAVKDTVTQISALVEAGIDRELGEADHAFAQAAAQLDILERRSRELQGLSPGGFRRLPSPDVADLQARIEKARQARDTGRPREAHAIIGPVIAQINSLFEAMELLQQEIDTAQSTIKGAAIALAGLEETAARLRRTYPRITGPLGRPDLAKLRQELAAAECALADDPSRANRIAVSVTRQALAQGKTISEYPAAGRDLTAAEVRLAQLERRERAAAARGQLASARRSLAAARLLHTQGVPGYSARLQAANTALEAGERRISIAEGWAALGFSASVLLLFLLVAAGFVLNRRRRFVKDEAEQLLADWRAVLDRKLEVLLDELERRVALFVGAASGENKRPHSGETLRLAEQIRADVGSLYILWSSASGVLQQAEALIRARWLGAVYNFFLPGKYRQGIALLHDEPVPFDPEGGLPGLFGHERTWRDDLLGDLESFEPFRKSFQEIVAELNLRAGRATEALDLVEWSVLHGSASLEETEQRIRATRARRQAIEFAAFADGLFLVPAVFTTALPASAAALARARALFPADPVGALQGDGGAARRIALEASQLAELVTTARDGVLPAVEAGAAALRQAGIGTSWIEAERIQLSERADLLAAQAAAAENAAGTSAGIDELARDLTDLGSRVACAVALSKVLGETARPETRRVEAIVRSARAELGAALGIAADRILREEDADPSVRLEGSARQADAAQEALHHGELAVAETALAEASRLAAEAAEIVAASRQAFTAQASTREERRAETRRVEALLPEHERILEDIRAAYAPSVLFLRAGDPEHPDANATLEDNLEEARAHVGFADDKLERSGTAFREGRLLAAADLLRRVKGHQELAVHRLAEVAERQDRLARTAESNRNLLETLEERVREGQVSIARDPRTMRPTVAVFEEGKSQVQQARRKVETTPGDPFLAEQDLLAARSILDEVYDRMAPSDRSLFAEAQNSVEAADRQFGAAEQLARRAVADGIPDSPDIVQALRELESLATASPEARETLGIHHGDWNAVNAEADRIATESARCFATLTGELAAAEKAAAAVSSAAARVRQASSWRGRYGVLIQGSPGINELQQARSLLQTGSYEQAEREAAIALQLAAGAIAAAEAEVSRLWTEERRRRDEDNRERETEARRHRQSSSTSIFGSGSSGGGHSSQSGGGSSGSGRSSWRGGGGSSSGSGRSGW